MHRSECEEQGTASQQHDDDAAEGLSRAGWHGPVTRLAVIIQRHLRKFGRTFCSYPTSPDGQVMLAPHDAHQIVAHRELIRDIHALNATLVFRKKFMRAALGEAKESKYGLRLVGRLALEVQHDWLTTMDLRLRSLLYVVRSNLPRKRPPAWVAELCLHSPRAQAPLANAGPAPLAAASSALPLADAGLASHASSGLAPSPLADSQPANSLSPLTDAGPAPSPLADSQPANSPSPLADAGPAPSPLAISGPAPSQLADEDFDARPWGSSPDEFFFGWDSTLQLAWRVADAHGGAKDYSLPPQPAESGSRPVAVWLDGMRWTIPGELRAGAARARLPRIWEDKHAATGHKLELMQKKDHCLILVLLEQGKQKDQVSVSVFSEERLVDVVAMDHPALMKSIDLMRPLCQQYAKNEIDMQQFKELRKAGQKEMAGTRKRWAKLEPKTQVQHQTAGSEVQTAAPARAAMSPRGRLKESEARGLSEASRQQPAADSQQAAASSQKPAASRNQ